MLQNGGGRCNRLTCRPASAANVCNDRTLSGQLITRSDWRGSVNKGRTGAEASMRPFSLADAARVGTAAAATRSTVSHPVGSCPDVFGMGIAKSHRAVALSTNLL